MNSKWIVINRIFIYRCNLFKIIIESILINQKSCLKLFMNPNAYQSNIMATNNSLALDNDLSHNMTHQELIKSRKVSQMPQSAHQTKEKSMKFDSINNLDQGSSQHLYNPPKTIQTRNILVRSSSAKNHKTFLQPVKQQHLKNGSTLQLNRINSNQQPHEPYQTFMRPKTMLDIQKKYQISSQMLKHKLPEAILDYIVSKAKLKNEQLKSTTFTQTGKKLSKLGLSKKLSQKYHTKKCNICQLQQPSKQFQSITKTCSHTFCHSCLHQYVIYKINTFVSVQCPNQQCRQILDQDSKLYMELPLDVRKKYKKLLQYEMMKQHPNRKMCPQEKCQGYIEVNEFIDTVCSKCKKRYCPKCLLPYHDGDCDSQHLQFFQGTLHYRQCNNCKNIIQKSTGCIHMTCRCGYQFCYLCGDKWKHSHTCQNPQQQPIPTQTIECCCCQIQVCDCQVCCDRCCQEFCGFLDDWCCCCEYGCDCCQGCECEANCCDCCFVMVMLKAVIFLAFVCLVLPFYLGYTALFGALWIFITLFIGSTMYTIEYISQLDGCIFYLAILFYPITMWIGILLAFRQVFCEAYVQNITQMGQDIWEGFKESMACD